MFNRLTEGFRKARQRLTGVADLTEADIDQALRDVRLSLLEADVELGVVKRFLARVKEQTLGQRVQLRAEHKGRKVEVTPEQLFVKACQDALEAMMAAPDGETLIEAPKGSPTVVMMVGLQGQGKTTTSAKLARVLSKTGKKVLLVAADLQRPAAVEQLNVLGQKVSVPVFSVPDSTPVEVCKRALAVARVQKKDVVILDTAGRLAIDTPLMEELRAIKSEVKPQNILLVVNAAIGQNALATAQAFHDTLGLTGVALTMLDGDARGGAALSIREVTGVPVRFVGTGEAMEKLEAFRPDGMASRILGMGDIVSVVNDFSEVIDEKQAEKDARKMLDGQFTLEDFVAQIETIQKMGPLQELFERLPFFADAMPADAKIDDRELDKVKAIVASMTREERRNPEVFQSQQSRVQRVARGSASQPEAVAELVAKFMMMRGLMGNIGQQAGFLQKLPGAKQLAMARRLKEMVNVQGENNAIANLTQELLQSAVAGGPMGAPGNPEDMLRQLLGGHDVGKARPRSGAMPKAKDARKKNKK